MNKQEKREIKEIILQLAKNKWHEPMRRLYHLIGEEYPIDRINNRTIRIDNDNFLKDND